MCANLNIGYYDQKQAEFKSNKTILDYVWDQYPMMNEKDVRAILGRFLFVQDDVKKLLMIYQGRKSTFAISFTYVTT